MTNFADVVDTLDAAIFTGDSLFIEGGEGKANRQTLQDHLERWSRELYKIQESEIASAEEKLKEFKERF